MRGHLPMLLVGVVCALFAGPAQAKQNPFDEFTKTAHRACPTRNLQYLLQGDWNDILLDGRGLSFCPSVEASLNRSAGHFAQTRHCARYPAIDCVVSARLFAVQSKGLMRQAVKQLCISWRCED